MLIAGATSAFAARPITRPASQPTAVADTAAGPDDHVSVTTHQIMLHGKPLEYEATAGTLGAHDEAGKLRANFFFVAYRMIPGEHFDPATRPITFVFNGGPGAAAIWLHMGAIGPMRVAMSADGDPGPPPHRLVENEQTWLDATDLVFIDPVGTGYSRAAEGHKPDEFFGVEQDISSIADFIRLYTTRYERWLSPKFLAGESYGTTRAAGLSDYLAERYGIDLNGIVLISSVLNFQTISPSEGNDLPFPLFLPSYTSVALYHHKLAADLQADEGKTRLAVEQWAMTDYTIALAKGKSLSGQEKAAITRQLAAYTGLPEKLIEQSNLRIDPTVFRKKLLNDQDQIIGRYDGRMTAPDPDPAGAWPDQDPSFSVYLPAYSATFNDYVRRELKYQSDLPYEALNGEIARPWNLNRGGHGYLEVATSLQEAMLKNPHLKLFVAAGYYDLATPYASANYTIDHLDLRGQLKGNITQAYYPAGHMLYHVAAAREKLRSDVGSFMQTAAPTTEPAQ